MSQPLPTPGATSERVRALLAGVADPPPFDVLRAAFAELLVSDLDASLAFYEGLLGLIVTERGDGVAYLRGWEERHHHSLVLREAAEPAVARLGFRVRGEADLAAAAAHFGARVGADGALHVRDEHGFPLTFVCAMERAEPQLQRYDLQRGAPVLRLDHFNLHVPRLEAALRSWLALGFRCSEYISTDGADERISGAWLMRGPGVHDVALTAGRGPRLHHVGMWVAEPAGVLRACDQLAAAGHATAIERGPGRHGVSNAFFVYLRDPDGHRIELYSCDYYTGDPDHEPLRWSLDDPRCRSFYGTRAPDSWYEESTTVLGLDGTPVETQAATVDERTELQA